MGLIITWGLSFLKGSILPRLLSLPNWVWYGLIIGAAIMYYGHWRAKNAANEEKLAQERAVNTEINRQTNVTEKAVENATTRAIEAEQRAQTLEEQYDNIVKQVQIGPNGQVICLPASITRQLRNPSTKSRSRP